MADKHKSWLPNRVLIFSDQTALDVRPSEHVRIEALDKLTLSEAARLVKHNQICIDQAGLILQIGANDIWLTPEEIKIALAKLLLAIWKRNCVIPVFFATVIPAYPETPSLRTQIASFNSALKQFVDDVEYEIPIYHSNADTQYVLPIVHCHADFISVLRTGSIVVKGQYYSYGVLNYHGCERLFNRYIKTFRLVYPGPFW